MEDLEFIKKFSKISITKACKNCYVNRANLINNRTTKENIKKVREDLESQVAELYIKKGKENEKN